MLHLVETSWNGIATGPAFNVPQQTTWILKVVLTCWTAEWIVVIQVISIVLGLVAFECPVLNQGACHTGGTCVVF